MDAREFIHFLDQLRDRFSSDAANIVDQIDLPWVEGPDVSSYFSVHGGFDESGYDDSFNDNFRSEARSYAMDIIARVVDDIKENLPASLRNDVLLPDEDEGDEDGAAA